MPTPHIAPDITPEQVRAARGLLDITPDALAGRAGISTPTVRTFEHGTRTTMPANVRAIRQTLEAAGIIFIAADSEHGPGVRLRGGV